MPASDADDGEGRGGGFRIGDIAGLVVGYGLAAFLLRSFRPDLGAVRPEEAVATVAFVIWLGLAMSGPFVLLFDRRRPSARSVPASHPTSRYAPEEQAWLGIGGYFLAIALFVVPSTRRATPWGAILAMQALVGIACLVASALRRAGNGEITTPRRWTRRAARVMLWTWPLAWVLLLMIARG